MYSDHRIPRAAQTRRQQRHVPSANVHDGRRGGSMLPLASIRPTVLLLAKAVLLPLASAAPLSSLWPRSVSTFAEEPEPKSPDDPNLYVYLGVAIVLVLLGGAFAGLTIALMGQDETYLQVLAASGEGAEKKHAEKVLGLLNKGKHWVLVTLLLSNVITNETLPIVLDRSLGGGWPAVLSSTVLIVIFGEIVPQSICVRYGLGIGSFMAPLVLSLMWLMFPVAWPTAKLLDYLLGKDHGTMYKKAGLKTLVTLHKSLGTAAGEGLMEDEVTIINSVLDLKDKPVGDIMTPMQDVFTMSADTILDERMMDTILSQGYSRIPIYAPENNRNFIGMLLVKILITYDPEDSRRVRDFALATLPETAPYTSCLDIINFFQEGKSHMVLVSDFPGQDKGALGVVTLEDVIEELIGEEIIDESDVFVDVHKAIRRMAPAPKQRFKRNAENLEPSFTHDSYLDTKDKGESEPLLNKDDTPSRGTSLTNGGPPSTFLVRRKSSTASDPANAPVPVRTNTAEMREHLRHLGPSNVASKPRATKFSSVKIKPGVGTIPEDQATTKGVEPTSARSKSADADPATEVPSNGANGDAEADRLLRSAGKDASDGTAAIRSGGGYGTMSGSPPQRPPGLPRGQSAWEASQVAEQKAATDEPESLTFSSSVEAPPGIDGDRSRDWLEPPGKMVVGSTGEEDDTLGDLTPSRQRSQSRRQARSGSITETEVEIGGLTKVVLEMTSSSEEDEVGGDDGKSAKSGKKGSGSSKD